MNEFFSINHIRFDSILRQISRLPLPWQEKNRPRGRSSVFNYIHIFTGSCFAFIHFNRNNLYRKQRLYSRLVKYNASFVFPKSIMAFLLSKLRFEFLVFHNSCDVYLSQVSSGPKLILIECKRAYLGVGCLLWAWCNHVCMTGRGLFRIILLDCLF